MVLEFRFRPELGEHLNTAPGAPRHLFGAFLLRPPSAGRTSLPPDLVVPQGVWHRCTR